MRRFDVPLLVVGIIAAAALILVFKRQNTGKAIASSGGAPLYIAPISGAHFLQRDARWSKTTIGGSGETIAKVGCTICSVAMAFDVCGMKTDPEQLNAALKKEDGFTSSGLLKWDAVTAVSKGKIKVAYLGKASYEVIDDALKNGKQVIAKIFLNNVVPHWVLIVGKEDGEYIVRDPLKETPVKLSSRGSAIHAIRVLKRMQ